MSTTTTPVPVTSRKAAPAQRDRTSLAEPAAASPVTADTIRTRAYEIYQKRDGNGGAGDAASDWLQAERELNGAAPEPTVSSSQARGEALLHSPG